MNLIEVEIKYNIIYKTINTINSMIYVGKHVQYGTSAFDGYLGSGSILKSVIRKYGRNIFEREILEIVEQDDLLNEREIYWISELSACDRNVGYNRTIGGEGQTTEKMKELWELGIYKNHSEKMKDYWEKHPEVKEKTIQGINNYWDEKRRHEFSNTVKERWKDHDYKQNMIEKIKTRLNIPEVKLEKSKKMEILWQNPEYRDKTSKAMTLGLQKESVRKRISEKAVERWNNEDYRLKTSKAIKEGLNRPEVKEKLRLIGLKRDISGDKNPMFGIKRNGSLNSAAKYHFVLKDPQGNILETDCLTEFCRNNNLIQSSMDKVCSGKQKQHKEWTCISKTKRECVK